tara:strand:- start:2178 stop:3212 length:1035 start_codon:yes stop_codon:yes gene_type:complete
MIDTETKIVVNSEFLYKKGLCGINNLGNTCFMNSILQCLSNTIILTRYFLENDYKQNMNFNKKDHIVAEQWNQLLRALWNKNGLVTPKGFLISIQKLARSRNYDEFTGFGQNDSQEFLQFFLEILHNSFSREVIMKISGTPKNAFDNIAIEALKSWTTYFKNDYSIIVDIFYGQLISELHTVTNKEDNISKTYEPFNTLSLEIDTTDNMTLYDCLDKFTSNEKLDIEGKNMYKKIQFWKLPKILVIFFKKFNNRGNKINTLIQFPIDCLDMSKYVVGYNRDKYKYELYGVTNHIGNTGGGHYTSHIKNSDNNWYKYNDDVVSTLKIENIVTREAYCCFYKLKET